ncbi:hypothetical protein ACFE04_011693 [Oxalis oulophora]
MTKRSRDQEEKLENNIVKSLKFLEQIRQKTNQHDEILMSGFVRIMKEYKSEEIHPDIVRKKVTELFKGHDNLLFAFNEFLPKKRKIHRCSLQRVVDFLNRVRVEIFLGQDQRYYDFIQEVANGRRVANDLESNRELLREYDAIVIDGNGNDKSRRDLDLSKLEKCTPNYYGFPKDLISSRKDSEDLNNLWFSSPNYNTKDIEISKENLILLRLDDIRSGLDWLVEEYQSAETKARDLVEQIDRDNENNIPINIDHEFTAKHLKCIARLCGEHVFARLRENTRAIIPDIVTGLKRKGLELRKRISDFDNVARPLRVEIRNEGSTRMTTLLLDIKIMEKLLKKEEDAIKHISFR